MLSEEYEIRREEQAGARLHLPHNVTEQTIDRFSVTHDSKQFETGSWLESRLAILNLAYFNYRQFALIDKNDGYFVSRLKLSFNPVVIDKIREWRGRHSLGGKKIFDIVDYLCCKYVDVEVEIEFDRREYAGTQSHETIRFRVVGVHNKDADDYHLYITNLSPEDFLPEDLATIYRCRWEVELLFRELKTQYRLDEMDLASISFESLSAFSMQFCCIGTAGRHRKAEETTGIATS